MKKLYRVNFDKQKNGFAHYVIDVGADNAKQARALAEGLWCKHFGGLNVPHMFHVKVRSLKDTEEFFYLDFKKFEYMQEV